MWRHWYDMLHMPAFSMHRIEYTLKTRIVMMSALSTLLAMAAPDICRYDKLRCRRRRQSLRIYAFQVVTTCGTIRDGKVGIMTMLRYGHIGYPPTSIESVVKRLQCAGRDIDWCINTDLNGYAGLNDLVLWFLVADLLVVPSVSRYHCKGKNTPIINFNPSMDT